VRESYYVVVQEPGNKLVPLEGPGSDRGIFWDLAIAERVVAALSAEVTQYEFHIYRILSSNNRIKGVVARYRNGTRK
jgi:hypothetical protein